MFLIRSGFLIRWEWWVLIMYEGEKLMETQNQIPYIAYETTLARLDRREKRLLRGLVTVSALALTACLAAFRTVLRCHTV